MSSSERLRAVLFDLDDTLYPQAEFLAGAWRAVAAAAPVTVGRERFLQALEEVASLGSDRGRIIDRALECIECAEVDTAPLVGAFRSYAPRSLGAYPGAREGLGRLRSMGVPTGLVTDGDPAIQRAKLAALDLGGMFDAVVFSDDLGRERRKPHPAPFLAALEALRITPGEAVFVGDRPDKDVSGATSVGIRAIRVRSGEYSHSVDSPQAWAEVMDLAEAFEVVFELLAAGNGAAQRST